MPCLAPLFLCRVECRRMLIDVGLDMERARIPPIGRVTFGQPARRGRGIGGSVLFSAMARRCQCFWRGIRPGDQSPPRAASAVRTACSGRAARPTTWPPMQASQAPRSGTDGRSSTTLASSSRATARYCRQPDHSGPKSRMTRAMGSPASSQTDPFQGAGLARHPIRAPPCPMQAGRRHLLAYRHARPAVMRGTSSVWPVHQALLAMISSAMLRGTGS